MKKLSVIATSMAAVSLIGVAGMGVASAASNNGDVGTSGIPRSVFKQDRLDAEAQVLNTTTANVQAAHKDKTFSSLLSSAGLTRKTFAQKVKTQLTSDLESQGYSQSQITIALQHRTIVRLHHKEKAK